MCGVAGSDWIKGLLFSSILHSILVLVTLYHTVLSHHTYRYYFVLLYFTLVIGEGCYSPLYFTLYCSLPHMSLHRIITSYIQIFHYTALLYTGLLCTSHNHIAPNHITLLNATTPHLFTTLSHTTTLPCLTHHTSLQHPPTPPHTTLCSQILHHTTVPPHHSILTNTLTHCPKY